MENKGTANTERDKKSTMRFQKKWEDVIEDSKCLRGIKITEDSVKKKPSNKISKKMSTIKYHNSASP